jgi:hypothetical protein
MMKIISLYSRKNLRISDIVQGCFVIYLFSVS